MQTVELSTLGATQVRLQFRDMAHARAWRERLRREQPDWVVDLNALALPMQSSAGDAAAPPRLYAQRLLGIEGSASAGAAAARIGVIDTPLEPLRNGVAGSGPAAPLVWAVAMRQQGEQVSTHAFLLAQAFDWLLQQQVQLINARLGGAGDEVLRKLIERLLGRGVALLAAAGNKPDVNAVFPAAYPGVWAVTAVDARGRSGSRASRGNHVSFAAPGVDLWVLEVAAEPR